MDRFIARLVPKGYNQIERVDYKETFSSEAMHKSIRVLLTIVYCYDYEIWQMDVKIALLNRNLDKAIDISQPEGFITKAKIIWYVSLRCSSTDLRKHLKHEARSFMTPFHNLVY